MIRVIELFSGIGAQAQALKELGLDYEVVATADIDKHANIGYEAIHGPVNNLGDVTKIEHLPECDLLTYSYPCLTGDTLVQTVDGWVPIKDVRKGMIVQTDDGERTVTDSFITGIQHVRTVVPSCGLPIKCTGYHPFLVRAKSRVWNNDRRSYDRVFSEPKWVHAENLTTEHYVGFPIPEERMVPEWNGIDLIWTDGRKNRHVNKLSEYMNDEMFWWTIGRYIADGWIRTQGGIVIGFGKAKKDQIANIPLDYYVNEERTTYKVQIAFHEMGAFCLQFGKGAVNKHIPEKYKHLPKRLATAMLEGYLAGDGHYDVRERSYSISTVSKTLALDIIQMIAYCYGVPAYVTVCNTRPTAVIEGRVINQHVQYQVHFKKDKRIQDRAFVEDGWVWSPIRKIDDSKGMVVPVYDITVDDRHCFNANGIIVKNCTSVSVAGKQEGMKEGSGTASALLWEVGRLLKDMGERNCLPEVLLMENVDAVLNQKNIGEFKRWLSLLSDMGYTSSYQIMNAKDYGTPQNRRRIFCVSTLTMGEFVFPEPCPDGRVLRDVLENNVPEKYFLSDERLATFKRHKERNEAKGNHFGFQVLDLEKDHVSKTVTTVGDRYCNTYIGVPEGAEMPKVAVDGIERAGQLNIEGWGKQGSEVVGTDGVSPCVTSQSNNTRLKIEIVGELKQPGWHEILQRVYGKDGLGPTLTNGRSPMLEDKE